MLYFYQNIKIYKFQLVTRTNATFDWKQPQKIKIHKKCYKKDLLTHLCKSAVFFLTALLIFNLKQTNMFNQCWWFAQQWWLLVNGGGNGSHFKNKLWILQASPTSAAVKIKTHLLLQRSAPFRVRILDYRQVRHGFGVDALANVPFSLGIFCEKKSSVKHFLP